MDWLYKLIPNFNTVKDIANVVFWISTSCVAIMTYRQAKKTLFAPIKTETFKLQLKAFEEILLFFQNKGEHDLISELDLENILNLNAQEMVDAYVQSFFSDTLQLDVTRRNEEKKQLVGGIISAEHAVKHLRKVKPGENSIQKTEEKISQPAILLAKWYEYDHPMISFTQKYLDKISEIQRLAASPLIPKEVRNLINEFSNTAQSNLPLIGSTITACAKDMTRYYPTPDSILKFEGAWISNIFNERRKNLKPISDKIMNSINSYLKIDSIMDG
ncbi:hypothetical protein NRB16_04195 [Pseudomonas sp. LJDD11]|uniref:hypothetical protein n=1 Tax=Pseudomonas sp. LJDD11 TaxID=2931984 RepID=UPI00211B8EB3|nr:hypothetical protein [Pseudomonas sp. LJDD11]MCQ9422733.1 hypothetical protein [Pseudomonas sp. LJDD11]